MLIGVDAHNLEGQRTGPGRYLFNLMNQWGGSSTRFIFYFKKKIPADLPRTDNFSYKLLRPPLGWFVSNALFTHYSLPRQASRDKIDALFCPNYISPFFYKGKTILTLHDIIYEARPDWYNWPSWLDKFLLKYISRRSAEKAAAILVCSDFTRQEVLRHYRVAEGRVFTVHLAADKIFRVLDKKTEEFQVAWRQLRQKYGLKDRFIFYLGSIFNRRHLPELILASQQVLEKKNDYQLFLVGQNLTRPFLDIDGLAAKANARLGRPAVLRANYLSDKEIIVLYNAADLFVYLSDYEGFGLPIIEAMSCGVLAVTSRTSSLPEVAGKAAIFIDNNRDTKEIAMAIEAGLTDQNLQQSLRVEGLARADLFSWEKTGRETFKIISDVAESDIV